MKPFDLMVALEGTKRTVDSDGNRWNIARVELFGQQEVFAQKCDGTTGPVRIDLNGRLASNGVTLGIAGDKRTMWANVYKQSDDSYGLGKKLHMDEATAKSLAGDLVIAQVKIEFED